MPEALQDGRKNFRTSATRNGGHQTKDPEGQPRGMATTFRKKTATRPRKTATRSQNSARRENPQRVSRSKGRPQNVSHTNGGANACRPGARSREPRRHTKEEALFFAGYGLQTGSVSPDNSNHSAKDYVRRSLPFTKASRRATCDCTSHPRLAVLPHR